MHAPGASRPHLPLLLMLCVLGGPHWAAADNSEDTLRIARDLEAVHGEYDEALGLYERVTNNSTEMEALAPETRGRFLAGAARCHEKEGRPGRAREYWERILADTQLPSSLRDWARERMEAYERSQASQHREGAAQEEVERILARRQEDARRHSRDLEAQARERLRERRFDDALSLCLEAMAADQENNDARSLLEQIEAARPDRGETLRSLINFVQTAQLEEYQHLKQRVLEMQRDGRVAFERSDFTGADRTFRDAILLIDSSGFLSPGAALDFESLKTDRATLLTWLRQTLEEGRARGLDLLPEPTLPESGTRVGGLEAQFLDLVAKFFTPRRQQDTPMRFYEMAPAAGTERPTRPLFTARMAEGIQASVTPGWLSRARWAERWIESTLGGPWMDPADAAQRRDTPVVSSGESPHILTRFGSVLCVQHRPEIHQRIEALRTSFLDSPPPLTVQIHLYAAGGGGAVRVAEAIRAQAGPRDSGRDVIVRLGIIEESVKALEGLQGLLPLGSAEVRMERDSSFRLALSRLTAEDPLFQGVLDPPSLSVPDADARYGLWLDLFAEDMARSPRAQGARTAFSIQAQVRRPTGSHVVPRRSAAEMPWTRLPILQSQTLEADHELPHFATFVLLGLANPFAPSRDQYPELVMLVGVRPQGPGFPDPPPESAGPRIVPTDERTRDHDLGMALTLEMQDEVLTDDWPDRRPIGEPLPPAKLREVRERHLAALLTEMAGLRARVTEGNLPVLVHDTRATATLTPDEHNRLAQAVARLRTHENELYSIDVLSTVVPRTQWDKWAAQAGVRASEGGYYTLDSAAALVLDREMRANRSAFGLYSTQRRLLARATQLVSHARLVTYSITRDLRVRVLGDGLQRYVPMPGMAEEGIVIEVRPDMDNDGRRFVYARARVARLRSIEPRPYPKASQPAAVYDVPAWFEGGHNSHGRRVAAELLDDTTSLLLPVDLPGASDQVVVVKIGAIKLQ